MHFGFNLNRSHFIPVSRILVKVQGIEPCLEVSKTPVLPEHLTLLMLLATCSGAWTRTRNPLVNSETLYHWATPENSFSLYLTSCRSIRDWASVFGFGDRRVTTTPSTRIHVFYLNLSYFSGTFCSISIVLTKLPTAAIAFPVKNINKLRVTKAIKMYFFISDAYLINAYMYSWISPWSRS